MKTVTIEVKTIYHIRFNCHDFGKIFLDAKDDPCRLSAFANFDLKDTTLGNIRECFKSLSAVSFFEEDHGKQKCENLKYIVHKLGFEGIDNYGGMIGDDKEYSITVYNRGADI